MPMHRLFMPHASDFYKTGHIRQYPPGTEYVYSNFTCRSDRWASMLPDFDHKVVFFGLQGVCQWLFTELWDRSFFQQPQGRVLEKISHRMGSALGPDAVSIEPWAELWCHGRLPLRIKALPEGSRVNLRVPMFTIENTDPRFYWATNYVETQLSAAMWLQITSATTAYEYRRLLQRYAIDTGAPLGFVPWQGHDFSYRGMAGVMDAAVQSGAAHLLSFTGTDTIAAIDYLDDYYWGRETFVGGSVPATEHSVMCMGGEDCEYDTFKRLITEVYPKGIVSIVSDTWDFWSVLTATAPKLRDEIMSREPDANGNSKLVFRPDSGDPVKIICGDPDAPPSTPEHAGAVEALWANFPGPDTDKGYRTLDSHVGLIYGDSISLERAHLILEGLKAKGFASSNIVFGIGSFTYQHVTRDTFGTAIKATFGVVNGVDRVLFKAPKTDNGIKNSARGLLRVEKRGDEFILFENQTREQASNGALELVFEDGKMMRMESLADIRTRLLSGLPTQ